ncbi:NAD(P)H-quinone oxidoreductase [Aminobacter ciceronei]|uniref:PIG3 family NAD(P)H quinone oxidoreductase n=1 Tax=Aminobacter ciceronei TaxID=150723 RepID=A0ABR6C349_9HYPH|nr:NAD(P)H-quinone oxidoreductase [Aminobacter ciceronei]MBA8905635.1 putative PIG3 family NAD(P)H quinone oxidoreductase [Aminobacter ciceronei]MBA9019414.1 putative PIG3 family NAD(P)H quinone oxidoreductase [Aminobacter ciceronei]
MAKPAKLPEKMLAVAISQPGGPRVLKAEKRDLPELGAGEILIRVHAAGVNRPDVQQRKGAYPAPPGASDLPGLEVSGEVAALGEGATRWRIGDAVCALTPGGGYAEYARVHETNALPMPTGFTFTEAAAVPETFFTVWHNVFERGALKAGETLLIHGGSSGIGTTAIQLASAFGAYVIVTAGSDDKCAACLKLGADRAINYRNEDFVEAVKDATGGKGADVILDMVGGDYVGRNYNAAAVDGRIVQIATQGGAVASADFSKLMVKRLTHTGSTLRPRTTEFKAGIAAALEAQVWPLLAVRRVAPVMDMIFPLKEAWRAHERMEEGEHIGKIVLDVG